MYYLAYTNMQHIDFKGQFKMTVIQICPLTKLWRINRPAIAIRQKTCRLTNNSCMNRWQIDCQNLPKFAPHPSKFAIKQVLNLYSINSGQPKPETAENLTFLLIVSCDWSDY